MRRSLPFLVLLLATAAACSQVEDGSSSTPSGNRAESSGDVANAAAEMTTNAETRAPADLSRAGDESPVGTGPDLDPMSAPGVAFDYRYSFRLEADRVARMQQEHQRLCERYGARRCRITGMDYRAANEDDVEAMLSFLVDPSIASQFGRESVDAVVEADGELTESEVTGTDVGTSLKANAGSLAELEEELARVEARLARPNLRRGERAPLDDERRSLRAQISELRSTTGDQERQLATTPILFRYGSGDLAPGPAREPTVGEAFENATSGFVGALNILMIILVTLAPWLIAGLLLWGAFRLGRRVAARPAAPVEPTSEA